MNSMRLLRYNFRVLMFSNWWLLVFPLAASQLAVFWNVITQRFSPSLPARSVEMISPLLAAFLSAHLLSAEYRSGMGAILASKPVHIGRVVLLRLLVVMGLVWALAGLSLAAYFFWMKPYDVLQPVVACLASSLFLALLALTFATRLRSPFAGFGIAALYWAMDLPPGPAVNPFLSLRSLASSLATPEVLSVQVFGGPWWIAKLVLAAGAVVLYVIHARLLFTLGTPMTARVRRQALGWAGALLGVYVLSGAAAKVGYGYTHRGRLDPDDAAWFRRQFAAYGPVPVASVFGPAFRRYLGEIPNAWRVEQEGEADRWGDTEMHRRQLREVVQAAPSSIWAPSAAELLARMDAPRQKSPDRAADLYARIVARYPNSPYTVPALARIARTYADAERDREARAAYERLLPRAGGTPYATEALRYLAESDRQRGDLPAAAAQAEQWVRAAPIQEKCQALVFLAEIQSAQGRSAEAKETAGRAMDAVSAFQRAVNAGRFTDAGGAVTKWQQQASAAAAVARRIQAR